MVQKLMLYGMPVGLFVSGFFFPLGVLLYWFTNNLWTLGQQFYILKKLPVPGAPAAKEQDGRPAIDPKSLAPRPGAKPVRNRPGRPAVPPADEAAARQTPAGDEKPVDMQKPSNGKKADQQGTSGDGTGAAPSGSTAAGKDDGRAGADGAPSSGSEDARPLNGKPVAGSNGSPRPGGRSGRAGQGPGNRSKRKRR
jgi:YidC/Oxa1 family membrane protein insertase